MRDYEFMTAFTTDEEQYKKGSDAVRELLKQVNAEIINEETYGDREMCYEIKKQRRGRYVLFLIKCEPDKILELDRQLKLNQSLLTYLFIRSDNK